MMEHEPLDKALTSEVSGKKAGTVNIKASPLARGARLAKRAKVIAALVGVVLFGLVLIGVMTAGKKSKKSEDAVNHDMVGATAPLPPPPALGPPGGSAASGTGAPSTGTGSDSAASAASANAGHGASGQAAEDPEAKYDAWVKEQHYKSLQAAVVAEQAGNEAAVGVQVDQRSTSAQTAVPGAGAGPGGLGAELQKGLLAQAGQAAQGGQAQNSDQANRGFQRDEGKQASVGGYLTAALMPALSTTELEAGSVIPAVMVTGINSDLPGMITAQVRQTVYDSRNPSIVLIPQGSKLVGVYNSAVQYGQQRLMVVWNELQLPDGSKLDLKGMAGADGEGQGGFYDQVDNHYLRIFGSAALISLFGAAAQLAQPQNSGAFNTPSASQQATAAMATQMDTTAMQLLQKNLNISPTLTIRPGYEFNVMVQRTLILPPWKG